MKAEIVELKPDDFEKCGNIWDIKEQSELARQFFEEILGGVRATYVYTVGGEFVGEISTVTQADDPDYTVPDERLYLSRLIVKEGYRRQGIGRKLVDHVIEKARAEGFSELSVGVDTNNYPALKLYHAAGFDRILFVGKDEWGEYMKLIKRL